MKFTILDVLILVAVGLAIYLAYIYLSKGRLDAPVYEAEPHPVLENTNVPMPLEMKVNNPVNKPINELINESVNKPVNKPVGKEKLRAANKKGDHLLLDQKDVKDKSNYICNKECPCDERTIGESLEDIRKQFLSPTESFYGNVHKSLGVSLEEGFKAQDGKEHSCSVKKMDEAVINSVLGCNKKDNFNLDLNNRTNNRANNNRANNNRANNNRANNNRANNNRANNNRANNNRANNRSNNRAVNDIAANNIVTNNA